MRSGVESESHQGSLKANMQNVNKLDIEMSLCDACKLACFLVLELQKICCCATITVRFFDQCSCYTICFTGNTFFKSGTIKGFYIIVTQ